MHAWSGCASCCRCAMCGADCVDRESGEVTSEGCGAEPLAIHCHSETHWQIEATLTEMILKIRDMLFEKKGPGLWLLVLDVAPVHVASATVEAIKEKCEYVRLAFPPPGTTAITQPADKCYSRPDPLEEPDDVRAAWSDGEAAVPEDHQHQQQHWLQQQQTTRNSVGWWR